MTLEIAAERFPEIWSYCAPVFKYDYHPARYGPLKSLQNRTIDEPRVQLRKTWICFTFIFLNTIMCMKTRLTLALLPMERFPFIGLENAIFTVGLNTIPKFLLK